MPHQPIIDVDFQQQPAGLVWASRSCSGSLGEDAESTFELMLPGDDGWAEYQFRMAQRRAVALSNHGWKFWPTKGPRGHYYEGFGPRDARVMTEQN